MWRGPGNKKGASPYRCQTNSLPNLRTDHYRQCYFNYLPRPAVMDCFGRIRSGYSSEDCQPLLVNTNIVYSIEKERCLGLGEDDSEPSLMICPQYLAAQRLTQGTQCLTAHLGAGDQSLEDAHRDLYHLLDDLDFLADDLPAVSDQLVDTLRELTPAAEDNFTAGPSSCQSNNELLTTGSPDCDDVFQFHPADNECFPTVLFPESSYCVPEPWRRSSTSQALQTSCCGADVISEPPKKRRYSSVSQETSDVTNKCIKRRKLNSLNIDNLYEGIDHLDFTVSSSLLSPLGVFSQSYTLHSPVRATSLRQW